MSFEKPITPLHPDADQEIEVQHSDIPKELASALDFDDEDDDSSVIETPKYPHPVAGDEIMSDVDNDDEPQKVVVLTMDSILSHQSPTDTDTTAHSELSTGMPSSCSVPSSMDGINSRPENFYDDNATRIQPLNPFEDNYRLSSSSVRGSLPQRNSISNTTTGRRRSLSLSQQSRLINYIDGELLKVQRKFIKYLSLKQNTNSDSDPEDALENEDPTATPPTISEPLNKTPHVTHYNLDHVLKGLSDVILLIWYSIYNTREIPVINHQSVLLKTTDNNGNNDNSEPQITIPDPETIFGQTSYLIKIMGDLFDYLEKYPIEDFDHLNKVLAILAQLDNVICILIDAQEALDRSNETVTDATDSVKLEGDGSLDDPAIDSTNSSSMNKTTHAQVGLVIISTTEKVRIDSIVNRTKMLMVEKFEKLRDQLEVEVTQSSKRKIHGVEEDAFVKKLEKYELSIGEVYDGIVDRTSL